MVSMEELERWCNAQADWAKAGTKNYVLLKQRKIYQWNITVMFSLRPRKESPLLTTEIIPDSFIFEFINRTKVD